MEVVVTGKHTRRNQNTLKTRNNDGVIHREYSVVDKGLLREQELTAIEEAKKQTLRELLEKRKPQFLAVSQYRVVGLKSDGTVVIAGNDGGGLINTVGWVL